MSQPNKEILNVDGNLDIVYPGSFVQGKSIGNGPDSLIKLPFPQDKRYNVRIIDGAGNFAPVFAASPSWGDIQYSIKEALKSSQGFTSGNFYYDLSKSTELQSLIAKFNFNIDILQKLDLDGSFSGSW